MVWALLVGVLVYAEPQQPPAADRPPAALSQLRDAAVAVCAPALAADWTTVAERLQAVNSAAKRLPPSSAPADLDRQLRGRLEALRDAVRDHQSAVAAKNANWVARLADELATSYETTVPADVHLLAFFGRSIQIDAKQGDREDVGRDIADLRTVWSRVEPMVLRRHGQDIARRLSDSLAQLDAATAQHHGVAEAAAAEIGASEQVAHLFAGTVSQSRR